MDSGGAEMWSNAARWTMTRAPSAARRAAATSETSPVNDVTGALNREGSGGRRVRVRTSKVLESASTTRGPIAPVAPVTRQTGRLTRRLFELRAAAVAPRIRE